MSVKAGEERTSPHWKVEEADTCLHGTMAVVESNTSVEAVAAGVAVDDAFDSGGAGVEVGARSVSSLDLDQKVSETSWT